MIRRSLLAASVLSSMSAIANTEINQDGAISNKPTEQVKLETNVVTATGYEQDVSKAPASMTVISRE